ncbi:hypothetical protein OG746_06495 [Streptomyces sp. NBC_01016]|uniref:hypothetical protein n=1 Tax=Streptomyces sp. NBC_01016 TaxID=2903720 RepID=UPI0022515ED3|nr:hypothetical protein [Streptomyces sp. NBC_01016]MCX4828370.1 hypothetical protein [Streptomyces sp. NBC_01016]
MGVGPAMVVQQHGSAAASARVVAAAAVASVVVGVGGCGGGAAGGERNADPTGTVRGAADRLVREGSSQARTSMEMASGGTRVTIHGDGVYDYRKGLGELRVRLPQDAAGDEEHRPITELLAPGALYMKNRGAGVPADKWVRVDVTTLTDGNLVTGGATDPLAAAELLRGARNVTERGETDIAGVRTRHYKGDVELSVAAKAASAERRGALEAAAKGFRKGRVPFDVYVDDEGLIRKVVHRFSFANGPEKDFAVRSTTLYRGFGKPVKVRLPAKGDIFAGKVAEPGP